MDEEDMSDIDYHLEWRKVQTRSYLTPPLKANSASVRLGDDLYLFGGQGAGQFHEVWRFCGKTLVWQEVVCTSVQIGDIPIARDGHTMVKVSETKVIIYAGQGGLFDSGKCERATEHGKVKYLSMRKLFDDMFELDVSTAQWTSKPRRKIRPLGRRGHTMTYLKPFLGRRAEDHSKLGNLLLFGGSCLDTSTGFEKVSNDVWLYSLTDEQWTEMECGGVRPRAVYGHSGVLMEESYVVVGGSYAPPKKEGFLSKAKALAPKKKIAELFSSALSTSGDNNSTVSVLNVTTFQWSSLNVDCIPYDLDSPSPMLNLTGHSAMENPLNVREILIFGGRAVGEGDHTSTHYADDFGTSDEPSFVAANLFTLNIDECTLKKIQTTNGPEDTVNVPEARLNHICQRNVEGHIVLNYNREDAKAKKLKGGRRVFDITAPKKQILSQPVTLVYGGFKANSSGFCDCSVHELFFVPNPNRKKKDDSDIKFVAPEDNVSSIALQDDTSHISKLSLETFDFDERSSTDRPLRSLHESESCTGSSYATRTLKLKADCSTQLLSPKRGVDGHYFDLKSALSYSKSTFIPSSSKPVKSPESEHPSSMLDPLSHKGTLGGEEEEDTGEDVTTVASGPTVLSAERMHFMSAREIMKTRTVEIAPKTKGMTVHNARSVYNRLYPLPGLPNSLKKRARNLK